MKKGTLLKYAFNSKLLDIHVKYGDQEVKFNLYAETVVDENTINREITEQPSVYGFLGMLHKKLIRKAQDKKREMEKIYASMFTKHKTKVDENTGRITANELSEQKVISSKRYQDAVKEYHEAQHEADVIEVCVRTFEQRQQLIQTLSANIRKTS